MLLLLFWIVNWYDKRYFIKDQLILECINVYTSVIKSIFRMDSLEWFSSRIWGIDLNLYLNQEFEEFLYSQCCPVEQHFSVFNRQHLLYKKSPHSWLTMNTFSSLCFGPVHLKFSYPVTQCSWYTWLDISEGRFVGFPLSLFWLGWSYLPSQ